MAKLNIRKLSFSSKTPGNANQISPTFEQLLREDAQYPQSASPRMIRTTDHNEEEYICSTTSSKKSVLAQVRERAKKLRSSLTIKRKQIFETNDGTGSSTTPSSSINLDDFNDDDEEVDENPEYLGAPMYESEAAPMNLRENARQHPRAVPVVSENHRVPSMVQHGQEEKPVEDITKDISDKLESPCETVSDATTKEIITSKIDDLTLETKETRDSEPIMMQIEGGDVEKIHNLAPIDTSLPVTDVDTRESEEDIEETNNHLSPSLKAMDKGVSIKEYLKNKLEPGDDERALSQAISEAISPRSRNGTDSRVVEKMKEVVTSLFSKEPRNTSFVANTSSRTPMNPNVAPHIALPSRKQVEEEESHQGKMLQTN